MTQPMFTVITTCLNRGRFIERTICSVLDQAHDATQYIVVDRGSTDATNEIIELYQDEMTSLSLPGASRAEAINAGLTEARGEFILVVDDLLLPAALHAVERYLEKRPDAMWLVTSHQRIDRDDREVCSISPQSPVSLSSFLMHDTGLLPLHASILHRSLIEKHGALDAGLAHAFDYELACRLLAAGVKPVVSALTLTAVREDHPPLPATATLAQGVEHVTTARRFMRYLPRHEQHALWRNCDKRQRIYALAEAELQPVAAQQRLWQQLVQHPWWIRDRSFRQTLVHGVSHPVPAAATRTAA
ncbi:MAG: glycosyltransferase [Phycisphaeraceae bacterium]